MTEIPHHPPFVRLSKDTHEKLQAMAQAQGISKRELVTHLFEEYAKDPYPLDKEPALTRSVTAFALSDEAVVCLNEQAKIAGLSLGAAYRQILIQSTVKKE